MMKLIRRIIDWFSLKDARDLMESEKALVAKRDEQPKHFFEWLNPADAPVVPGLEAHELVFAKDQPEYIPLRALRARTNDGRVMSRWSLTAEQRKAVADGADIFLTLMTFGNPLQPISMAVATDINPDYVRADYQLGETLAEMWQRTGKEIADAQRKAK
jgi:hypothetical protein